MATITRPFTSPLTINTDVPEYFHCHTTYEGGLKRSRSRQDPFDVVLIVGDSGKRIPAHRLILIASSDYFSALFNRPMDESQDKEIILNNMDVDALEKLVNFCYTGIVEFQGDTIDALLTTAYYLQLNDVVEAGCEFLIRHLQASNCLDVVFFAQRLNLEVLQHKAEKLICEHFEDISKDPKILLLNAKQVSLLIASDDLFVPSEEFVFHFVMKWIEYEPDNRKKHFAELLDQVRMLLLTPTFLGVKVEPYCSTTESQKLVLNAIKSHLLHTTNSAKPRNYQSKSDVKHLLAICEEGFEVCMKFVDYNFRTKVWTMWNTKIDISENRFSEVVLMDDMLITVGGFSKGSVVNTVTSINLRTMVSTEMAPLKTSRQSHAVAILNGLIYVIGGYDRCRSLNSVERWDPMNKTWSFVAPMKHARSSPSVAVFNDQLYVSGGYSGTDYLTSVECYDPVENSWRSTAPMKVGRMSHCLAAHNAYLFAIGGRSEEFEENEHDEDEDEYIPIERYDPCTDTWTTISYSLTIYGYSKCNSLGPDTFIYVNSSIYIISRESSGDNLKLQILATPQNGLMNFRCKDLVAIPYEINPAGSWIKIKQL